MHLTLVVLALCIFGNHFWFARIFDKLVIYQVLYYLFSFIRFRLFIFDEMSRVI